MKEKIKIGFIGHGLRGYLINICLKMSDVEVAAVCDMHPDRAQQMSDIVFEQSGERPYMCTNHHDMIKDCKLDAVVLCTSWSSHIPLAIDFMNAGIAVGSEVGGCDSVDEIWQLVETYRRTKTEFMMLENCCYGRVGTEGNQKRTVHFHSAPQQKGGEALNQFYKKTFFNGTAELFSDFFRESGWP